MNKFFLPIFCVAFLMMSCSKDNTVPKKPAASSPGPGYETIQAVFLDEITGQPIPSLNVRFTEQWGTSNPPYYFWQKTDASGRIQCQVRADRNLMVSIGVDSGTANYYLNLGELQIVSGLMIPAPGFQGYWIPQGLLTFPPVNRSAPQLEFKVDVPRKADLVVEYVQDSAYKTSFNPGDISFYFYADAMDSSGRNTQMIGTGQTFVGDGTPYIQSLKLLRTYAGRPHKITWFVLDSERVNSYYDDGQVRELRRGEIIVPPLSHQQPTKVTIHF